MYSEGEESTCSDFSEDKFPAISDQEPSRMD